MSEQEELEEYNEQCRIEDERIEEAIRRERESDPGYGVKPGKRRLGILTKNDLDMMPEGQLRERLIQAIEWNEDMKHVIDPYLIEDDGSVLIPDHARVYNMLKRLSK